ncbi:MAG: hypothetical protein PHV49_00560 [Alistipes sp.]|nr:hypothetical protein [Alistipes sp.]
MGFGHLTAQETAPAPDHAMPPQLSGTTQTPTAVLPDSSLATTSKPLVANYSDSSQSATAQPLPPVQVAQPTEPQKKGFLTRVIEYYDHSNVDRTFEKKIDWSIAPGPNYSSDIGFGIGFLIAGLYRLDRQDSLLAPSNLSIYGNITTEKFALLRFGGDNLFKRNRYRISYSGAVVYFPGAFYGVGYYDGQAGYAQKLMTTMYKARLSGSMMVWPRAYVGVSFSFDYTGAKTTASSATEQSFKYYETVVDKVLQESGGSINGAYEAYDKLSDQEKAVFNGYTYGDGHKIYQAWRDGYYDPALADPFTNYINSTGENPNALNTGIGLFFQYDTRDVLTNPYKGILAKLEAKAYPKWLGNSRHSFGKIQAQFDIYQKIWKGCILAYDLVGNFTLGQASWHMYSNLGGMERMRGYYEGRYRDRNCIMTQVELRQKLYRRHGVVGWFGLGNVWGRDKFELNHTLYSFGCGYRFEFKKRMNIRLDYGWGVHGNPHFFWDKKRCTAFLFTASEAF